MEVNSGLTEYEGAPAILAIVRNITERKLFLKELEMARALAVRANKAKSAFLANMSHEIRTPISAIIGLSHLALRTELTGQQEDYLFKIDKSANSLLRLLNDILDFSKIEAGRLELENEPFHILETLDSLKSIIGYSAQEKGLEFSLSVDERIPTWLSGDSFRLEQVLLNLSTNAIKFTSQGSVSVHIALLEEQGDTIRLQCIVRDTGMGIDKEQLGQLFQPFRQADASITRHYGGTGLGLAISMRLVALMGGEMHAESEPGKGSVFSFTANFTRAGQGVRISPALLSRECVGLMLSGRKLLLAEDSEMNLQVSQELLEQAGASVVAARNGQEALDKVRTESFDLVLMDMHMPVMDGLAAATAIRERFSSEELPILAMTANAMEVDRRRCFDAGMNGFLAKPLKPQNLYGAVLQLLGDGASGSCPAPSRQGDGQDSEMPSIEGLDVRQGLFNTNHDRRLYLTALQRMLEDHRTSGSDVLELVRQKDLSQARRMAHTIKGAAATIGASRLGKTASDLEQGLDSGDPAELPELADALVAELEDFLSGLDTFFVQLQSREQARPASRNPAQAADGGQIPALLDKLIQGVSEGDPASLELVRSLKDLAAAPGCMESIRLLERQIGDYDFDNAGTTLKCLAKALLPPATPEEEA